MDKLISIIVPVYNSEKYLTKCVKSIMNQTYKNIEIILVDDGSIDNSPLMCDNFKKLDKRIKVIHKSNGGLSSARNQGIEVAIGDYIGFVDSDDYIMPEMYANMLALIDKNKADMAICGIDWINEDGSMYDKVVISPIKNEVMTRHDMYKKLCSYDYFFYVTACNKLYKKNIFNDIRFPLGKIHEDEFVVHYVYSKCERIVSCEEKFYKYIQHKNSIMHSNISLKKLDAVGAFYDRYIFCKRFKEKKCANFALLQSYGILIYCIQNLEVNKYKKDFNFYVGKVFLALFSNFDLRWVKLLYVFYKKKMVESGAFLRFLRRGINKLKKSQKKYSKVAIILATPEHGNLGDQAIVKAEKLFLQSNHFNKDAIVEICNSDYLRFGHSLINHIRKDDLIIIDGGGNLGSLWKNEDDKIACIISQYPNNKIIIFPQTVFYTKCDECKNRIQRNAHIYASCKGLVVCLRDKCSYDFFINNFPFVKVLFVPDIALSFGAFEYNDYRNGALVCFRNDLEKDINDNLKFKINDILQKDGFVIKEISTLVNYSVNVKNRDEELNKKWHEFASSEIVITDRLHAMIFAAITNTPCVALDNKSKKISGTYEWIKDNKFIKCVESESEIVESIQEVLNNKGIFLGVDEKFNSLRKIIK